MKKDKVQTTLKSLESVTKELKRASNPSFSFNILEDSLFNVNKKNSEQSMVKQNLDIIYWIHAKTTAQKNSMYALVSSSLISKPEAISVNGMREAGFLKSLSEQLSDRKSNVI